MFIWNQYIVRSILTIIIRFKQIWGHIFFMCYNTNIYWLGINFVQESVNTKLWTSINITYTKLQINNWELKSYQKHWLTACLFIHNVNSRQQPVEVKHFLFTYGWRLHLFWNFKIQILLFFIFPYYIQE